MKRLPFLLSILLVPLLLYGASPVHLKHVEQKVKTLLSIDNPDSALWCSVRFITRDDSLSNEETEQLFAKWVFPFADTHKAKVSNLTFAVIYRSRALTVSALNRLDEYRKHMETSYQYINQVEDSGYQNLLQKGAICYNYGYMQLTMGDITTAHKVFYQSIRAAEKVQDYNKVMDCLYAMAIYYSQTLDTKQLDQILAEMQKFSIQAGNKIQPRALYSWYSVATARYSIEKGNPAFRDSAMLYSRKSIDLIERNWEEFRRGPVNAAWSYYNHALFFTDKPFVNEDSASYYLEKARAVPLRMKMERHEVALNIHCAYATLYKSQSRYSKALQEFKAALCMMDADTINNGIRQERLDAYTNIVDIYSILGNYKEVSLYQQKIIDYHQKVYNHQLTQQLKEISAKFNVEKKDLELRNMQEKAHQQTIISQLLTAGLIATLVIILFVIWIYLLHRRRLEDRLYQAALEAEMHLQELDTIKSQYTSLKEVVNAQQISHLFEKGLEKMKTIVTEAQIEESIRNEYLKRLSATNPNNLEQQFATSLPAMTPMDVKYILCFYLEFEARDIATIFNVEPASVYTVRYRLRKKFRDNPAFQFLMR